MLNTKIEIWTDELGDYRLLDSGNGKKLEQVGSYKIVRPEPRAWWKPALTKEWDKFDAEFTGGENGRWNFRSDMPREFAIDCNGLASKIKLTKTSKHLGVFPEQSRQWSYIKQKIQGSPQEVNVLTLFGYTGMATLAAASAGAKVTHVDASKASITWARENQNLSKLENAPVRWIPDDAMKFVKREIRRGNKYDALILDPPSYGRGPQGEVWKIEDDLPALLDSCRQILSEYPRFVILTTYTIDSSSLSLGNLLADMMQDFKGSVTTGELVLKHKSSDKLLPMSIFAMWEAN